MTQPSTTPLQMPTSASRPISRQVLPALSCWVASARTVTVSVCVPALPPSPATIGNSMARMAIRSIVSSNRLITEAERKAVTRLTSSHELLQPHDREHALGNLLVADAGEALDVLVRLLLDDVDDVVDGDHADQPARFVDHADREEIVALEEARHVLLVVGRLHRVLRLVDDLLDLGRALRAEQLVERHGAEEMEARIDDEELGELVGQPRILAHEVDRLADRPERRHGDEMRRHPPAGGFLRIVEPALQRDALGERQAGEHLLAVLLVEVADDLDGVVGIELADGLGDLLVRDRFRGSRCGPCRRPRSAPPSRSRCP